LQQLAILHDIETEQNGTKSKPSSLSGLSQQVESRRRDLFFQNKFQLSERRPGALAAGESRFGGALSDEDRGALLSKLVK
jgi:hypothetical protein